MVHMHVQQGVSLAIMLNNSAIDIGYILSVINYNHFLICYSLHDKFFLSLNFG